MIKNGSSLTKLIRCGLQSFSNKHCFKHVTISVMNISGFSYINTK